LLALLGAHHILHVSRIRVKRLKWFNVCSNTVELYCTGVWSRLRAALFRYEEFTDLYCSPILLG